MGLFNIFNSLDTKNNNGLNLIYDGKTKNLLYAYNKKNGKIEGLLQVFYSVKDSSHNPNYKRNDVGLVNKEFVFINGLINGDYKEYDSNGNLFYYIENIKSNSFNFILKFSGKNFYENKQLPVNDGYQINGFLFRYNSDGTFSKAKFTENNNLLWENYYQNGQIMYNSFEKKYYYPNGQLKEDLSSGKEYYEDGAIKKTKNGEEFYNNGQLKKNLKSGEEYCENGQLKFDLINGREYYENGQLKIKNDCGAKYLLSENINPIYLKSNNTYNSLLENDSIINDNRIYDYYKNVLIYNEEGTLYKIKEIIKLLSQEEYYERISKVRERFRSRGGHISITLKEYFHTKYSEPILINNFCFVINVKYYNHIGSYEKFETTSHLIPYTGIFNKINYSDGINLSNVTLNNINNTSKNEIEKLNTKNAIEFNERGVEKYLNNDYEGAFFNFTKAIEINAEYVDAFENRGRVKASLKDYSGAIEDFNKAIEIYNDSRVYSSRARMKKHLFDFDGALLDYNIAIKKFPQEYSGFYGRGELKYETTDYIGAIEDFNKCIELKPKLILSFQKLGECRLKIEDYKGAIEVFSYIIQNRQEAYKIDGPPSENASKTLATYYHNRGVAKSNIKVYKDAISDFKKAVELNPEFEEAKYFLKTLENNY